MKAAKVLTESKYELKEIYEQHDLLKFREFLRKHRNERVEFEQYVDAADDVLSELMYEAKSGLMYLGAVWQDARDHVRAKKFSYDQSLDSYPKCITCEYFRNAPSLTDEACIRLGSTPADICCPGYKSSRQN